MTETKWYHGKDPTRELVEKLSKEINAELKADNDKDIRKERGNDGGNEGAHTVSESGWEYSSWRDDNP